MNRSIDEARRAAQAGRWNDAETIARQALEVDQRSVEALELIALARQAAGDAAGAEKALREAIAIDPARRWPYGDLARLLMEQGREREAEVVARQALRHDGSNADAHMLAGRLMLARGLAFEAAAHLRSAITYAGRHPDLLLPLGQALMQQGRLADARPVLEEVLTATPDRLGAICALAEVEEKAGRLERASALLDRAEPLARRAGTDVALQRSTLLARQGKAEDALRLLEGSDAVSGAALLMRGRLHDRLGRFGEAWADWTEGKRRIAQQTGRAYHLGLEEREAQALAAFAQSHVLSQRSVEDDGAQPFFILGFPRSGTTLVEQVLAAHDAIVAGGELPFGQEMREQAGDLSAFDPEAARGHYLNRARQYGLRDGTVRFFTDKMPLNEMHLPLIRRAFPQAKLVRVLRHPLDVLVSVMSHDMTHGQHCAYRIEDAARHLALVQRQVEAYAAAGINIDHIVRYESLVADQGGQTAALMAALGLEMQDGQLAFHELPRHAPTPSYAQVSEPLNDRSIGRWRHYAEQLAPIMPILAKAMETQGYAG